MRSAIVIAAILCASAAAAAPAGRYELEPVEGGFLRLDRETGETALCQETANGYVCRLAAEERTAFEDEIARLESRIAELERQLAAAGRPPGVPAPPPRAEAQPPGQPPAASSRRPPSRLELPSNEELDELMSFFEKLARRFLGAVRNLDKDEQRL